MKRCLALFVFIAIMFSVTGCNQIRSESLDPALTNLGSVALYIGDAHDFSNENISKTFEWSSSDPSIASVTNGIAVAIKPGTTVITAKDKSGNLYTGVVVVNEKTSTTAKATTTKTTKHTTKATTKTTTKPKATECVHTYSTKIYTATCTEKGYTLFACTKCKHSYKGDYKDAKHSYVDGYCNKCKTIDKDNARQGLITWIKTNGDSKDGFYSLPYNYDGTPLDFETLENGDAVFSLMYTESRDELILHFQIYNDILEFAGPYILIVVRGSTPESYCSIFADYDGNTTGLSDYKHSDLSGAMDVQIHNFVGDENLRETIKTMIVAGVIGNLDSFNAFLVNNNLGISIRTFGFTNHILTN